jgi:hypothetical protein
MPPFVILGLPRSRTYWLSHYLSYGGWHCGHDELRRCRSLDDAREWLARPRTGTAETVGARYWRMLWRIAPETRVVVVRRDPGAVFRSLIRLPYPMDAAYLARELRRQDRALDQVAKRWPGALTVTFDDLAQEAVCARVFEHCLPYSHDHAWWASLADRNLQADVDRTLDDAYANAPMLERIQRQGRPYILRLELLDGYTFGHIHVGRWSARIARQLRGDWDQIIALHGGPVFVTTDTPHGGDYAKYRKFMALMGLRFHATVPNNGPAVYARWR